MYFAAVEFALLGAEHITRRSHYDCSIPKWSKISKRDGKERGSKCHVGDT